jgi:hypothetical protein
MKGLSRGASVAVAAAVALGGCAPITRSVPVAMPSQLVGNWQAVSSGGGPSFPVRFSAHAMALSLDCGVVSGTWSARAGGLFVMLPYSLGGSCLHPDRSLARTLPAWVAGSTNFEVRGVQRLLEDLNNKTLVTLTPAAQSALPDPERYGSGNAANSAWATAPPFSVALAAAQFGDVIGRWRAPTDHSGSDIAFGDDGSFVAHVGCNLESGRWVLENGSFLALPGGITLKGCAGADLLENVAAIGRAGPRLVLFDRDGHQLRELWYAGDA